jgi:hypothetical protein
MFEVRLSRFVESPGEGQIVHALKRSGVTAQLHMVSFWPDAD